MSFDIDHIRMEDVEDDALESAEILFDFPEVAMEWGKGADPTKTHFVISTPFLKRPFVESYMPEMKKTYSALIKKLVPIALDVARNEHGIARIERIDMSKILEMLEDTDYNYLATKLSDHTTEISHGYTYDHTTGNTLTTTNYDTKFFREYVRIRRNKGDAVLSVDIANVYYQNRFFNKTTEINRRMSDAFNAATKNQYVGKVFLTSHFAGSDDGKSQDKIALQLEIIIDSKYRA